MKWTPRQLMLPVIIAMSLTGVSLTILWLIGEQERKDKGERVSSSNRERGFVSLQVQVPREFVPVIIGRGGSNIKNIEATTMTRIKFDNDNLESPHRMCTIKGSAEGLKMAETMIKNMIACQPLVENYEIYVPQRVCHKIIGRCGDTVNHIQASTKAKIIMEKSWSDDPNSKRRVIIKGTTEQIAAALSQIEDKIHEYTETLEKLVAGESSRSPRGKITPRIPAVNPSANNQLLGQPGNDPALNEGTMEVYVSALESPSQFWVQVAGEGTLSLDDLVAAMTNYYENDENRELHLLKNVTVGQTVAAKFLFDGKWYRAEIISVPNDDECEVYFLDYGDREVVSMNHVLELRTDFLSLRLQAIECTLANVKPRDGEWSTEACDRFGDLTWVAQWRIIIAKVRGYKERASARGSSRREGSPIPCVDLYDRNDNQDINIGKQLVVENFAEADDGSWSAASSTVSLSRRSNENPTSSTPVRSPTTPVAETSDRATGASNGETASRTADIIEEIDLTTPKKFVGNRSVAVEEIDLVTPVRTATRRFIDAETFGGLENGGGDADRNVPDDRKNNINNNANPTSFVSPGKNIPPAGYETDGSDDSEGFTLG